MQFLIFDGLALAKAIHLRLNDYIRNLKQIGPLLLYTAIESMDFFMAMLSTPTGAFPVAHFPHHARGTNPPEERSPPLFLERNPLNENTDFWAEAEELDPHRVQVLSPATEEGTNRFQKLTKMLSGPNLSRNSEPIRRLIKGTYRSGVFKQVSDSWSPASRPLSPTHESNVTLEPVGTGVSGAMLLKLEGIPTALVKIREFEMGTENNPFVSPRMACLPGTGPFIETLCAVYIEEQKKRLPGLDRLCIVPKVTYARMEHPDFAKAKASSAIETLRDTGTGVLQEFIPGCVPASIATLDKVDPRALEFMALIDLLLLNSDRHYGNALLQSLSSGNKLVMIDHAYCLPLLGEDGGRYCWLECASLKAPPSQEILDLVRNLDVHELESIAHQFSEDLLHNLESLTESQRRKEIMELHPDQLLAHKMALIFVQEALCRAGWTLSEIGEALSAKQGKTNRLCEPGLIFHLCNRCKQSCYSPSTELIRQICQEEIARQRESRLLGEPAKTPLRVVSATEWFADTASREEAQSKSSERRSNSSPLIPEIPPAAVPALPPSVPVAVSQPVTEEGCWSRFMRCLKGN